MRVTPLTKAVGVFAFVGVIGFGINLFLEHRAKTAPAEVAAPVTTATPQPEPVAATPAPAPAAPVQPAPSTNDNAGLNHLLQQGKK